MNNIPRNLMGTLRRELTEHPDLMSDLLSSLREADLRRLGRLLALLLSLAVVVFLYAMVLTRGGVLR